MDIDMHFARAGGASRGDVKPDSPDGVPVASSLPSTLRGELGCEVILPAAVFRT